jgi:hypothetical protein
MGRMLTRFEFFLLGAGKVLGAALFTAGIWQARMASSGSSSLQRHSRRSVPRARPGISRRAATASLVPTRAVARSPRAAQRARSATRPRSTIASRLDAATARGDERRGLRLPNAAARSPKAKQSPAAESAPLGYNAWKKAAREILRERQGVTAPTVRERAGATCTSPERRPMSGPRWHTAIPTTRADPQSGRGDDERAAVS